MEHRCNDRIPVDLQVRLYLRGTPAGRGVIRNLSRYGLFIDAFQGDTSDARGQQRPNGLLEFEIDEGNLPTVRLQAVIAHANRCGFGVELLDEPDTVSAIDAVIAAQASRTTR